jgi:hypothetical protein
MNNLCRYTLKPSCPQPQQVGAFGLRIDTRCLPDRGGGGDLPPVDYHDDVFIGEQHCITPVRSFVELCTLGEGP